MLTTIHAATGIAIASYSKNPIRLFIFAFLSHFILDALPHWDRILPSSLSGFFEPNYLWIDFILAGLVAFVLPRFCSLQKQWLYWLGAFAAVLPDGLTFLGMFLGVNPFGIYDFYIYYHGGLQWTVNFIPGILSQLAVLGIMIYLFIIKAKQECLSRDRKSI